jgi:chromosome segregation ATPase
MHERGDKMTKHAMTIKLPAALAILSVIFLGSGCQKGKIESLNAELTKAIEERDSLKSRIVEITTANEQLRQQYDKLMESQKSLQNQIAELILARDTMQKQVQKLTAESADFKGLIDALTKSRDEAAGIAKKSQEQVTQLVSQLQTETKKVLELQEQLKNVQGAFKEFQDKIKL